MAGAHDDDCASTLDLLSPGAFKGGAVGKAVAALSQVPEQPRKQQQRQQQIVLPASSSLKDEWNIPSVLLATLEENGVTVPTPMQSAVWTAGRGSMRTDLLVHVSVFSTCCLLCPMICLCVYDGVFMMCVWGGVSLICL